MYFSTRVAYSTVITPTGTDCKRRRERHRDKDQLPVDLLLWPLTKTDAGVEQGRDVSTDVGEDMSGGCASVDVYRAAEPILCSRAAQIGSITTGIVVDPGECEQHHPSINAESTQCRASGHFAQRGEPVRSIETVNMIRKA